MNFPIFLVEETLLEAEQNTSINVPQYYSSQLFFPRRSGSCKVFLKIAEIH